MFTQFVRTPPPHWNWYSILRRSFCKRELVIYYIMSAYLSDRDLTLTRENPFESQVVHDRSLSRNQTLSSDSFACNTSHNSSADTRQQAKVNPTTITTPCVCVCVCVCLSSGFKGQCFNYAIPIAKSYPPMTSLPYLGLVVLPLRTPRGDCEKGFQLVRVSWLGFRGNCFLGSPTT